MRETACANPERRTVMPALAALVLGLQLLCSAHVIRTGRPCQWLFIILALPLAGCLVYFLLEILPELTRSRAARQAVRDIGAVIDPERDLRELARRAAEADTVENRTALAQGVSAPGPCRRRQTAVRKLSDRRPCHGSRAHARSGAGPVRP